MVLIQRKIKKIYLGNQLVRPIIHPASISLDKSSLTMSAAGQTGQLTAKIRPANATNKNVSWSSSNTSIATVSSTGLVTCVTPGDCTITATTQDGGLTATCSVMNPVPVIDYVTENAWTTTYDDTSSGYGVVVIPNKTVSLRKVIFFASTSGTLGVYQGRNTQGSGSNFSVSGTQYTLSSPITLQANTAYTICLKTRKGYGSGGISFPVAGTNVTYESSIWRTTAMTSSAMAIKGIETLAI